LQATLNRGQSGKCSGDSHYFPHESEFNLI
jgi:hypothetical protein